jgi:DNA-binding beta-propeller fold protein YncE
VRRLALSLLFFAICAGIAAQAPQSPPAPFHIRPIALFNEHLYEGGLESPMGIFFDEHAREVWVTDTKNNVIGCFTPEGVPLFAFTSDLVREPSKVAIDPKGRIYVLDNDRSKIKIFSYRGEPLGVADLPGVGERPVFGAITIDLDGNLYVGENESCQVLVFGPNGKPRGRMGECGSEPGQFQAITGIAVTKDSIVVTDAQVVAVQVFDRKGNLVRGWGAHEMGIANFSLPQSVVVDSGGRVIAIDMMRHEIKFFDSEGHFLDRFGGLGWRLGQVAYPAGIAIDSEDHLYVVEKGNARVQVFAEAEGRPPSGNLPEKGPGAGEVGNRAEGRTGSSR